MDTVINKGGAFSGRQDTDFAGGTLPWEIRVGDGDWTKPAYLPTGEKQKGNNGDRLNCVTQSNHNDLELQLNQMLSAKRMPEAHYNWLAQKGYFDSAGKVNFSEKYNSILNKTAEYNGNWLYKVADDARKNGLIPQSLLPENVDETWDTYYNPAQITAEMLSLGKEFLTWFSISYEWINDTSVSNIRRQLRHAPIQVIIPGHAIVEIYNKNELMDYFDSYQPWIKSVAQNRISDYFKLIINPIMPNTNVKIIKDSNSSSVGFWLPATSPEALHSLAANFNIEVPKNLDGSTDWEKAIQGTLTLN